MCLYSHGSDRLWETLHVSSVMSRLKAASSCHATEGISASRKAVLFGMGGEPMFGRVTAPCSSVDIGIAQPVTVASDLTRSDE